MEFALVYALVAFAMLAEDGALGDHKRVRPREGNYEKNRDNRGEQSRSVSLTGCSNCFPAYQTIGSVNYLLTILNNVISRVGRSFFHLRLCARLAKTAFRRSSQYSLNSTLNARLSIPSTVNLDESTIIDEVRFIYVSHMQCLWFFGSITTPSANYKPVCLLSRMKEIKIFGIFEKLRTQL